MKTPYKGWNLSAVKLSANGSTSLQTLQDEKKRLEARQTQIPVLIANLSHSTEVLQNDSNWLKNLNDRRRKDWEKENSITVEQAIANAAQSITSNTASLSSLKTELERIPEQLTNINRQLNALVSGESEGLTKGLTTTAAQQMGELALQKEQNQITQEKALQEAELKKAQEQKTSSVSPELKKGLTIGAILLTLALIGYVIYKRRLAAQIITTRI